MCGKYGKHVEGGQFFQPNVRLVQHGMERQKVFFWPNSKRENPVLMEFLLQCLKECHLLRERVWQTCWTIGFIILTFPRVGSRWRRFLFRSSSEHTNWGIWELLQFWSQCASSWVSDGCLYCRQLCIIPFRMALCRIRVHRKVFSSYVERPNFRENGIANYMLCRSIFVRLFPGKS